MKIVYIILAHKLPGQLVRLVRKLDASSAFFLIHVDQKTNLGTYHKMMEPLKKNDNVIFLKRYIVNWGCFGHVEASMEGVRKALALRHQFDFDYTILLTGQDYPIKSNSYIQDFLEHGGKRSYLEYFLLPSKVWQEENGGMDRINYWHVYLGGRPRRIVPRFESTKRKMLGNIDLAGGRTNWCLTRECLEYINDYIRKHNGFFEYCKRVACPDEIFFQTILLNSHLKDQLINDNLKYVVWAPFSLNPKLLRTQDYEQFIGTQKLFARKFDSSVDSNVLDMIDQTIS